MINQLYWLASIGGTTVICLVLFALVVKFPSSARLVAFLLLPAIPLFLVLVSRSIPFDQSIVSKGQIALISILVFWLFLYLLFRRIGPPRS
jgi:hypothetical protein